MCGTVFVSMWVCGGDTHRAVAYAVWWNFSHLSAFGLLPFFINSINRWAAAISKASRWFSSHTPTLRAPPPPLPLLYPSVALSLPRSNTPHPPPPLPVWGAVRPFSPKSQGLTCTYMQRNTLHIKADTFYFVAHHLSHNKLNAWVCT